MIKCLNLIDGTVIIADVNDRINNIELENPFTIDIANINGNIHMSLDKYLKFTNDQRAIISRDKIMCEYEPEIYVKNYYVSMITPNVTAAYDYMLEAAFNQKPTLH